MITVQNLCKTFRGNVQALRNLDLEIPGSGMFGLLGVNGTGKTTLMRILAGLLEPTRGQVRVFGNDLSTPKGKHATRAWLGYLPQELGLYPDLTAREFLDYIAILKGIASRTRREQQIEQVLDTVGIANVADRKLKTFSGGMKQRVGIAQALLGAPRLLIVDEPTAGLDPEERVRFRNLLAEAAQNCAVILSTHIVEDIDQSCNDMVVLWQGTVLFRGAPSALVAQVRGKVWTILSRDGRRPDESLRTRPLQGVSCGLIVSTRQSQDGTQYRVLGEPGPDYAARGVEPRLEDGYLWLMNQARTASALSPGHPQGVYPTPE